MKSSLNLACGFLLGIMLLTFPAPGQAQTPIYTDSYGEWYGTTNNGTITITGFFGYGSVFTGSNDNVTIPSSINGHPVTAIGNSVFAADYGSLGTVNIPNSITSIGTNAFSYCTYLTKVLVGNGVTNLASGAFAGCNELAGVYFLGNAPGGGNSEVVYVEENTTNYYLSTASGWASTYSGYPAVPWNPFPALGIAAYSNQPVLYFPAPASFPASIGTNYVIQMTTNLASGNWVTVTNAVTFIGVEVTNTPGPAFFRLQ